LAVLTPEDGRLVSVANLAADGGRARCHGNGMRAGDERVGKHLQLRADVATSY